MVERTQELDAVFQSLSDSTRRDMLRQVSKQSLSVSQIAVHYKITFAAVAKHLDILHKAKLIRKDRRGKEQIVSISPETFAAASVHLESYKKLWENRLDKLDVFLKSINKKKR